MAQFAEVKFRSVLHETEPARDKLKSSPGGWGELDLARTFFGG